MKLIISIMNIKTQIPIQHFLWKELINVYVIKVI